MSTMQLKIWTDHGPLGLDLKQHPLIRRAAASVTAARPRLVPVFTAERTVRPHARPVSPGLLM